MTDVSVEPPLPPVYELPGTALDAWSKLDADEPVNVAFTRGDLDNLMMGLRQSIVSQMALAEALRAASVNDLDSANESFVRHQLNVRDAYSHFNKFIEHVMTHAQQGERDGR